MAMFVLGDASAYGESRLRRLRPEPLRMVHAAMTRLPGPWRSCLGNLRLRHVTIGQSSKAEIRSATRGAYLGLCARIVSGFRGWSQTSIYDPPTKLVVSEIYLSPHVFKQAPSTCNLVQFPLRLIPCVLFVPLVRIALRVFRRVVTFDVRSRW